MRINTSSIIVRFFCIITLIRFADINQSKFKVAGQNLDDSSSKPSFQASSNVGGVINDLNELTDKQLEEICTSRGFELVKDSDKDTGQPIHYSHQDYIDAARQCLEIEAEMYVTT